MGPGSRCAVVRRFACSLVMAAGLGAVLVHGQIPGRNVNMVSGTTWPDGDPFLQRQNEPSVAASTRNPLHLLGGANDYRTVDLPGVNGSEETGDAWLGLFKSTDGGQRWTSTLLPGYPQDPLRAQSPLRGYTAAADPVVRAGTNGLMYFAGLAFNRGENGASGVFVSRFIDNNNRENGDPFAYLGTRIVASDSGATSRFLDKPWLAVDMPRDSATCPVSTTVTKPPASPGGTPVTVTEVHNLPAGPVYVAFSAFTGSGPTLRSEILFSYSTDCAATWSAPQRLSAADDSINQGASIAIDPATGNVYVAWRRFTRLGSKSTDAMMVARSVNLGRRFVNPHVARKMPRGRSLGRLMERILEHRRPKEPVEVEQLSEFDQGTSAADLAFRTNSYPTIAFDERSRLYMAWTERGFSSVRPDSNDGDAKIVMSTSNNGVSWTSPAAVAAPDQPGHQIMPSLAFAGGKLLLLFYDLREDVSQVYGRYIDDKSAALSSGKRHTVDIRASLGTPGPVPAFRPSVRVSDYFIGHRPGGPKPDSKLVPCPVNGGTNCEQLQFNPPNLPMFKQGTVPFIGDYIDITPAPAFVPAGKGGWTYNTARNSVPVFHAVWTDNRDVRPPKAPSTWADYRPPFIPDLTTGTSVYDPSQAVGVCIAENTGMRNQNIYTARITGGLLVGSPANAKPLSATLQRGFVVFAQNMTTEVKTFRMKIASQPVGGSASFQQIGQTPVTFVDVVTPPRSAASRTVFVTSSDEHARVNVDVFEISGVGSSGPAAGGLTGVIILNADIENADIENADIENADIENTEVTSADIENPTVRTADIENADIENADIENADIENADIENADIENADIENADIENTPYADAPLTDVTWAVANTGNTTTAFNVNLFLSQAAPTTGVKVQLILHKSYLTPAAAGCDLKVRSNTVLIANITNPVFVTPDSGGLPDPNSPDGANATLWLGPGETGKFTLRIRDIDPTNNVTIVNDKGESISIDEAFVPGVTVTPIVVAQEIGTRDLEAGVTEPPITTIEGSTMFFVQQPVSSAAGVVMAPVRVQVRDKSGAVLPNVDVTLSLAANPAAATLGGLLTASTDESGIAVFDNLQISVPGEGYRLRAVATLGGGSIGLAPVDSVLFNISVLVLNTGDAGPGSLREAIVLANANTGVRDVVSFAVPGAGPQTITLESPLPAIVEPVALNGRPGGACDPSGPAVEIDGGNLAPGSGPGLLVTAGNTTIRGLSITGFRGNGIELRNGGGNRIECSYVGLAPDGVTAKGNAGNGIHIVDSAGNVIGGPAASTRNVISANTAEGLRIDGALAANNVVEGNYVGTDAAGTAARGNGASGIYIRRAPGNSLVGNVVSGNTGFAGIAICGSAAFCGGTDIGTQGSNASGNIVHANRVGTAATGPAPLGNAGFGVSIDGAPNTSVGAAGAGNAIASNAVGVRVFGQGASGNQILQNSIYDNAGLGIDLGDGGVTPNDAREADGLQNFPTLTSVITDGGTTTIQGTLHGTPNTEFAIELFTSASCDPSGNGEGQTWFATVLAISTNEFGDLAFAGGVSPAIPAGTVVTATATAANPPGGTSEFSSCVTVAAAPEAVGPAGGAGGSPFSISCAPGSRAVALRGRAGDDIVRTELWCRSPFEGAVFAGGVGGDTGVDYDSALTCPASTTMTGVHGRAGTVLFDGEVVDTLGVLCTDESGAVITSQTVGIPAPGTSPFGLSCPAGKSVVGIFGGQGSLLDRIGIYCQ